MENTQFIIQKDNTANPGPLGLCGFGLSTILLNLHNAGLFGMDTMILAMGIFFGGITQIIVGSMEWKKNNIFGTMAFTSYGSFWLILVALLVMPKMGLGEAPTPIAMGYFLTVWGILSLGFFVVTLKLGKAMAILFASVVILFALLAAASFTGNHTIHTIAGIEGVICGSIAIYIAMAQLFEAVYGRQILPLK
ncbi:acetate uptake transporter [Ancylomarina sp.]|uniref:acetate uptake transporter n=1 Tax=Ancylomarina sp. TaxID=1970196 RepID=UPI00356A15F5